MWLSVARTWLTVIIAWFSLMQAPATAHEFWLDPSTYLPKVGEPVAISIRIGQYFKGTSYPFIREEFRTFVAVDSRGKTPVKGVDGDDPAVTMTFPMPGLVILAHDSTSETLVFDTWEKFEAYLRMEGLDHIAPLHRSQGKPETKITEVYSRCAKLLLDVGSGGGEDRAVGLPLELVAERNPYRLRAGEKLPVRLLYQGKPIAGLQITAISKADPTIRHNFRTDAAGRAEIPLPASGPWLLNAVHMIEPAAGAKAHWTSLWASLNFERR